MKTYGRSKYGDRTRSRIMTNSVSTTVETEWIITTETKLLEIPAAIAYLSQKGIKLNEQTVRSRCRSGAWQKGVFWVRPVRSYLINVAAIVEAAARGDRL